MRMVIEPRHLARVRRLRGIQQGWDAFRRWQLHRDYRQRRDRYHAIAVERGLVYKESEAVAAVQARVAARGYTPPRRLPGSVHTFAFVPDIGWHRHLLPDLRRLGPVTL